MPQYDTTAHLLPSVRQRAFVPQSNATFKPVDTLRMMTEVLHSRIVPELLKVREEYYVTTVDVPFVAGVAEYVAPARALGGELRDVLVVQTDGKTRNLDEMDPERLVGLNAARGTPNQFTMRADFVQVAPIPDTAGESLRFVYHRWPSVLIETSAAARITTPIFQGGPSLNLANDPVGWTTAMRYDVVEGVPPFRILAADLIATVVGAGITFTTNLPTGLKVTDYVCIAGESPVAQIPYALYPLLVEATAGEQMRATGDLQRAAASDQLFEVKLRAAKSVVGKRVKGEVRRMTNGMDKWRGPAWKPGGWSY